jgi:hypothetical protein
LEKKKHEAVASMQPKHFLDLAKSNGFFIRLHADQMVMLPGRFMLIVIDPFKDKVVHGVRMLMLGSKVNYTFTEQYMKNAIAQNPKLKEGRQGHLVSFIASLAEASEAS